MSSIRYDKKNVLDQSGAVLNYFNSRNQSCFEHTEAFELFNSTAENTVLKLLSACKKTDDFYKIKSY